MELSRVLVHRHADGRPRTKCVILAHMDTGIAYIPGFVVSFVLKVAVIVSISAKRHAQLRHTRCGSQMAEPLIFSTVSFGLIFCLTATSKHHLLMPAALIASPPRRIPCRCCRRSSSRRPSGC